MKINNKSAIIIRGIKIIMVCYIAYLFYAHLFTAWIPRYKYPQAIAKIESNNSVYLILSLIGTIVSGFIISVLVDTLSQFILSINLKRLLDLKGCSIRGITRSFVLIVVNIILAAGIGLALLMLAYLLPTDESNLNIRRSAEAIIEEGTYPQVFTWCFSKLDNFTDSAIINEAIYDSNEPLVEKAIMVMAGLYNEELGYDPVDTLTAHIINGQKYDRINKFPRYWHGYMVLIKPLLQITDYNGIRVINAIIQVLLVIILIVLMKKRGLGNYILPFLFAYCMLMPIVIMMSIQFSSCFYIFMLGIITMLMLPEKQLDNYAYLVFVNIGILLAYFDYLTYPMITFGMPAIMFLLLRSNLSCEKRLIATVKNGIAWCIGYVGMWASKWIITAIFTDYDIMNDAFGEVGMRISGASGDGSLKYSAFVGVLLNYFTFLLTPLTLILVLYLIYLIRKVKKIDNKSEKLSTLTPYIVMSFAPVVWFMFATNHSMIHYWFTSKACAVSVMALLCGLIECTQINNE